jgi:hypothetical protein
MVACMVNGPGGSAMAHEPGWEDPREKDAAGEIDVSTEAEKGTLSGLSESLPHFMFVAMFAAALTGWIWLNTRGSGPTGPTLSTIHSFLKVAWWAPGLALFIIGVVVVWRIGVSGDKSPPEKTGEIFRLARDVGIDKPYSEWTKQDFDRVVERHFQEQSAGHGVEHTSPWNDS